MHICSEIYKYHLVCNLSRGFQFVSTYTFNSRQQMKSVVFLLTGEFRKAVTATTEHRSKSFGNQQPIHLSSSSYHWWSWAMGSNRRKFGQKFPSPDTAYGSIMPLHNEVFHWCQDSSKSRYSENGILSCSFSANCLTSKTHSQLVMLAASTTLHLARQIQ